MLLVRTVLRPSPIEGLGVFAEKFIARGTPMWRFTPCFDVLLPPSFCADLNNAEFLEKYAQQCTITGYYILCADDARFINHSDDPNLGAHAPLFDPAYTHDALRDIQPGEEITCDYRIGDIAPFSGFGAVDHADRALQDSRGLQTLDGV